MEELNQEIIKLANKTVEKLKIKGIEFNEDIYHKQINNPRDIDIYSYIEEIQIAPVKKRMIPRENVFILKLEEGSFDEDDKMYIHYIVNCDKPFLIREDCSLDIDFVYSYFNILPLQKCPEYLLAKLVKSEYSVIR